MGWHIYSNVMPVPDHSIKKAGEGLARQATEKVREAGLVDESTVGDGLGEGREVLVYGFDGLMLVVDKHEVSEADRAELVTSAASDTGSIYLGREATVGQRGNGYQVQLPGCTKAGFFEGDKAKSRAARNVLFIYDPDATQLVADLILIRGEQTK